MRLLALTATAALFAAGSALAAPPVVTVEIAPKLQEKFEKTYGQREAERLSAELKESVDARLAKTGAYEDARIELTLQDAQPNRPTFKQLTDTPGLSMQSFGIGGASIEGKVIAADGAVTPVSYTWYETDIRDAYSSWTWSDATWTFERFANRLAKGEQVARR